MKKGGIQPCSWGLQNPCRMDTLNEQHTGIEQVLNSEVLNSSSTNSNMMQQR